MTIPPASDRRPPELSVVVPIYNEEQTIAPLLDEIAEVLDALGKPAEIIVVDDGSSDGTGEIVRGWGSRHAELRMITFPENAGQGAALYAGLGAAAGEVIVTLDGDGQNVPADIPKLLEKLEGCDLVVGIRQGRRDTKLRRWMSKVANGVRARLLGDGVSDSGCALKAMRREAVGALIPMQTLYSFVPALVAGGGFRVREVPVTHRERLGGTSHYSLRKMLWRPFVDMIGVAWFNRRRSRPQPPAGAGLAPLMVAAFLCAAFFLFLGKHGLLEPDEGRYAEVAREMGESGDLVMPTLNGFSHVEKPPVIYWFTALSFRVFGVSEFAARLPSALAALGIVLLTAGIAREFGGRAAGWRAALVLASTLQFFLMARLLTADMMMAFWITAAVACAVRAHFHPRARACRWLFFVFMGIGFLTKGPMALVVPLAAAAGLAWKGGGRTRLPWLFGIPLCLAISVSWFVAISVRNPELFDYFIKTELRDRFLSSDHGRHQPFWFFLPVLIVGFFPWTFLLIPEVVSRLRRRGRPGSAARFLAVWLLVPLLVLSLSGSKLLTYVLPLFPALAVGVALAFGKGRSPSAITMRWLGAATVLLAAGLLAWRYLAPGEIRIAAGFLSIVAVGIAGVSLLYRARRGADGGGRVATVAATAVVVWLAVASQVGQANHLLGRQASMRPIARVLRERIGGAPSRVIVSNLRAHGVEFYLGREVEITRRQADRVLPLSAGQSARLHKSSKSVARIGPRPGVATFAITRARDWNKYFLPDGRWRRLAWSGEFVLLELDVPAESP